jgi:hypothetical protein
MLNYSFLAIFTNLNLLTPEVEKKSKTNLAQNSNIYMLYILYILLGVRLLIFELK